MSNDLIARLDRWIAVFGKPMAPGGANPDNDMIYLLRDVREALSKAGRMFKDFVERSADDVIEIKRQRDAAEARVAALAGALGETASGQVKYWRDSQIGKPCLDDAINDAGEHTPIGDSAAWDAGYRNGRYSEADWWQKKIADLCALASLPTAGEKGDFVLVPREPTPEMIGAFWRVKNGHHFSDEPEPSDTSDYTAYRAMLAVSPSPDLITDAAKGELPAGWLRTELASIDGEIAKWPVGMRASLDAAMKASPAKMEWRDIASAPKNGTEVLLLVCYGDVPGEVHIGNWSQAYNEDEVDCWWSTQADDEITPKFWAPMLPLPASPKGGE